MRDNNLYLADILAAINSIQEFSAGMTIETFWADDKTSSAVIRKLEVIGEAARAIPQEFKDENPDLPWKEMAGMRDRLIHAYFGIDHSIVWDTIQNDLPPLKMQIEKLSK